jgi:type I restriction enzyme S subunit
VTRVPLGTVATIDSGAGFPVHHQGRTGFDFPFIKVSDMNLPGNERRIESWNNTVSEDVRRELRAKAFPAGTLVFPKIGAAIGTNKKRQLTRPTCADNNVMAVVPDAGRLDSDYLYFAFLAKDLSDFASASNPPSIRKSDVEGWKISVPSMNAQRRIVDLLSRAEGIVRLRRQAQQKAAALIPAIFVDMFGDPATNPKGWPRMALVDLIASGPTNGLYKHKSAYGSGTPILRIDAFYDGRVTDLATLKRVQVEPDEQRRFALLAGDIIVNRVNSPEYLGKSALVPELLEPTVFESNMMRFSIDASHALAEFVIALLQDPSSRRHFLINAKHAINQSSINQQDVKSLPVFVPPLEWQRQFAQRVAAVRAIEQQQQAATSKAEATFSALLARAFAMEVPQEQREVERALA